MTISAPPAPAAATVRPATAADAAWLARAMAAAFYDDPVFAWFFPDERGRMARYERFFRLMAFPMALPRGASATTEGVAGGALWLPPGEAHAGGWEQLRMFAAMFRVAGRGIPRAVKGMHAMENEVPQEDHWNLWLLGVAPVWQGRGIGSQLLRPILDRADDEGMPAFLQATTPRSRALYERHGFATHDVMHLPDDGPPLWNMWREPRG